MTYRIKNEKVKEKEEDVFRTPNLKEEKEDDVFGVSKEEKEQEAENYKNERETAINEINDDLYSEQMPIEVKDETTLIVKAGGETHTITRKDIAEYQKQEGSQSGYRQLGSIRGDWRMIESIANDISYTFNKLDERLGNYKTSYQED